MSVSINEIISTLKARISARSALSLTYDEASELMQYIAAMENTIGGAIAATSTTEARAAADATADVTFAATADALADQK